MREMTFYTLLGKYQGDKVPEEQVPKQHYCKTCKHVRPLRSKHCRTCNRCVSRFDHHCVYTNNCVGAKNHFAFVFFLTVELLHVACMGYLIYYTLVYLYQDEEWNVFSFHLAWQLFMTVYCWAGVVILWLMQMSNVATNWTTNERINRHKYEYLRGVEGEGEEKGDEESGEKKKKKEEGGGCDMVAMMRSFYKGTSPFDKGVLQNMRLLYNGYRDEQPRWDQK